MERKVVFSHPIDAEVDLDDGFFNPKFSIDLWFETYDNHCTWVIVVEFVRERLVPVGKSRDVKTVREVVFENRIQGNKNDFMLAKAANACDHKTSSDIAHGIFWTHIVEPSVLSQASDDHNWFKIHARKLWDYYARSILGERDKECGEVHDS